MRLILARHGNTFTNGEVARWVGANEDLPLVASGEAQAKQLAKSLKNLGLIPNKIFSAPLKRTFNYAKIIHLELQLNIGIKIDPRLTEINFGKWSNKTNAEIIAEFGQAQLDAWTYQSQIPLEANWTEENQIRQPVLNLAQELQNSAEDPILVVSSNGKLRYFLDLIEGEFAKRKQSGEFKIATGNVSGLEYINKSWIVRFWNVTPDHIKF